MTDTAPPRRSRWRRWIALLGGAAAVLVALFLIAVAAFPASLLRGAAEHELTVRFGRPVTIGDVTRDSLGFTPTLSVREVRVAQAPWAGPGLFARVGALRATFSVWPLLLGRFHPRDVHVEGLRLALVRAADGRRNWVRPGDEHEGGNGAATLEGLTIRDAIISYRDARRDRMVVASVSSDATRGVRVGGSGTIRGTPVAIAFTAPPVGAARGKAWPFVASIDGPALVMHASGMMDRALDTDAMTLEVTAHAADLRLIDAVIEAGLFGTQPVTLAAYVRHDRPRWRVAHLHGRIGRSDFAGHVTIDKVDGRTKLAGQIAMRQLDFDDLSSDAGLEKGAALERAIGPRVVPDTRIDLHGIGDTDGTLRFSVGRIVSRDGNATMIATSGVATLDHRRLTVSPLTLRLPGGVVTGSVRVDQRDDRPLPVLTADVSLSGSSLRALGASGDGAFTGAVTAKARLHGAGKTIRAAIAASDGTIGFVVRDGSLPAPVAAALGFDAGRALLANDDDRAGLRCIVARLRVMRGTGRTDPLVVDTTESRMHGNGTLHFPDERLDVRLTGAPKHHALLKLPGMAYLTGTLSDPRVTVPPEVKSVGNIFKAIGRAIKGTQGPLADDADCDALATMALK